MRLQRLSLSQEIIIMTGQRQKWNERTSWLNAKEGNTIAPVDIKRNWIQNLKTKVRYNIDRRKCYHFYSEKGKCWLKCSACHFRYSYRLIKTLSDTWTLTYKWSISGRPGKEQEVHPTVTVSHSHSCRLLGWHGLWTIVEGSDHILQGAQVCLV